MEPGIHELTAGYALDALDPAEREEYERHLAGCERCQEELASFWEVTGALAVAADGPEPPPGAARADPRGGACGAADGRPVRAAAAASRRRSPRSAAIAAVVAIGLGIYANSLNSELDDTRSALSTQETCAAVLADPNATTVSMAAGTGRLVVANDGSAVLVLDDLSSVPSGRPTRPGSWRGRRPFRRERSTSAGPRRRADPAARAGRRGRRGDDRGRGRREHADARRSSPPRSRS